MCQMGTYIPFTSRSSHSSRSLLPTSGESNDGSHLVERDTRHHDRWRVRSHEHLLEPVVHVVHRLHPHVGFEDVQDGCASGVHVTMRHRSSFVIPRSCVVDTCPHVLHVLHVMMVSSYSCIYIVYANRRLTSRACSLRRDRRLSQAFKSR